MAFFRSERGFDGKKIKVFEYYFFYHDEKSLLFLIARYPEDNFPEIVFFVEVFDF